MLSSKLVGTWWTSGPRNTTKAQEANIVAEQKQKAPRNGVADMLAEKGPEVMARCSLKETQTKTGKNICCDTACTQEEAEAKVKIFAEGKQMARKTQDVSVPPSKQDTRV